MLDWFRAALARSTIDLNQLAADAAAELSTKKDHRGPAPDFALVVVAAAVLDDHELWQRAISDDQWRDRYHYDLQRDAGMSNEDLVYKPTFATSLERLHEQAQTLLSTSKSAWSSVALQRLSSWAAEKK